MQLEEVAAELSRVATVEVVAPARLRKGAAFSGKAESAILETLRRRPCTAADLGAGLGLEDVAVLKALEGLICSGSVRRVAHDATDFYEAVVLK